VAYDVQRRVDGTYRVPRRNLDRKACIYNFTISSLGGIEDGGVNEAAELRHMEWTPAPRGSVFQPRRTETFHSATAVLA
jgi:hypothetical protein